MSLNNDPKKPKGSGLFDNLPNAEAGANPTNRASGLFDNLPNTVPDSSNEGKGITGHAKDLGLSLLKSAIAVPETAVGLADIPTGGRVGKFLENEGGSVGFRPHQAKEFLSEFHTDQFKQQQQEFAQAEGVIDKGKVALTNPSLVTNTVAESLLPMLGSAGVARKLLEKTGLGKMGVTGAVIAGGIGEGAAMSGMQSSEIRGETEDGLLTPKQAMIALSTGVLGGLIGIFGGRLAQKLGIGDVDTMLARGSLTDVADEIARSPAKSIPRQIIEGAIVEGVFEELPQSVMEVILQNIALDKEWSEGVDDAIVMGTLAGAVMGAGASGLSAASRSTNQTNGIDADLIQPTPTEDNPLPSPVSRPDPSNGVISRAANEMPATQAAADIGSVFPESRDFSAYSSADNSEVGQVGYSQEMGLQASQLEKSGDMDNATRLRSAQNLFRQVSLLREQGNEQAAGAAAQKANTIYQRVIEAHPELAPQLQQEQQAMESGNFPILYESPTEQAQKQHSSKVESSTQSILKSSAIAKAPIDGTYNIGKVNTPTEFRSKWGEVVSTLPNGTMIGDSQNGNFWQISNADGEMKLVNLETDEVAAFTTDSEGNWQIEGAKPPYEFAIVAGDPAEATKAQQPDNAPTEADAPTESLKLNSKGQPFVSEEAAMKSQPYKRNEAYATIVPSGDGFAVRIDEQAKANSVADRKQKQSETAKKNYHREPDVAKDDLLGAIAQLGGLNLADANAEGLDIRNGNEVKANLRSVFTNTSEERLDGMAERLKQFGYLTSDDPKAELLDKLQTTLNTGKPINASDSPAAVAELERQAEERELQQEQELKSIEEAANEGGTRAMAEAMGYEIPITDNFDQELLDRAIADALVVSVPESTIEETLVNAEDTTDAVLSLKRLEQQYVNEQSRSESSNQQSEEADPFSFEEEGAETTSGSESLFEDESPLLTTYSEADLAQQEADRKAEAKRKADADAKAKADEEIDGFDLAGSNRPADAVENKNQGDILAPANEPKASSQPEVDKSKFDERFQYPDDVIEFVSQVNQLDDGSGFSFLDAEFIRHVGKDVLPEIVGDKNNRTNTQRRYLYQLRDTKDTNLIQQAQYAYDRFRGVESKGPASKPASKPDETVSEPEAESKPKNATQVFEETVYAEATRFVSQARQASNEDKATISIADARNTLLEKAKVKGNLSPVYVDQLAAVMVDAAENGATMTGNLPIPPTAQKANEPDLTFKANGSPFATESAAKRSIAYKRMNNPEIVAVEGGFGFYEKGIEGFTPKAQDKPPESEFSPAQAIRIAADDISTLRKVDVGRVLDQDYTDTERQALIDYIMENRPDLQEEVSDVMAGLELESKGDLVMQDGFALLIQKTNKELPAPYEIKDNGSSLSLWRFGELKESGINSTRAGVEELARKANLDFNTERHPWDDYVQGFRADEPSDAEIKAWEDAKSKPKSKPQPEPKPKPKTGLDAAQEGISAKKLEAALKLKKLLDSRKGQLNSGIDPEVMIAIAEVGALTVAEGAIDFAVWVRDVIATTRAVGIQDEQVKPFLKEAYAAISSNPDKYGVTDTQADQMATPKELRKIDIDSLVDTESDSNQGSTELSRSQLIEALNNIDRDSLRAVKNNTDLKKLVAEITGRSAKDVDNLLMKEAQEAYEVVSMVDRREQIVAVMNQGKPESVKKAVDLAIELYDNQPNLDVRTAKSSDMQAYSTPAPMALMANLAAGINQDTRLFEPTAGNGLLLVLGNPQNTFANELDPNRADALAWSGFNVTAMDGSENPINSGMVDGEVDAVVANPPFGAMKDENGNPQEYNFTDYTGRKYSFGDIDHVIAKESLSAMKDDGSATLILGAPKETGDYTGKNRQFLNWLYSNYNVEFHAELDGKLYKGQGAAWPTQFIVVKGRARQGTGKYAPIKGKIERYNSWGQLYENLNTAGLLESKGSFTTGTVGNGDLRSKPYKPADSNESEGLLGFNPDGSTKSTKSRRPKGSNPDVRPPQLGDKGGNSDGTNIEGNNTNNQPDQLEKPDDQAGTKQKGLGNNETKRNDDLSDSGSGNEQSIKKANEFQAFYQTKSGGFNDNVLVPLNIASWTEKALTKIHDSHPNGVDGYVMDKLGYDSLESLYDAFMGLQIDAVAMSINAIENGRAVIIGDQTGVGKGRQAAALIRYAMKQGKVPVFVTQKPNLFTDMYDDLQDIGSKSVAPLIMNNKEGIVKGDKKLFNLGDAERGRLLDELAKTGKMPEGYDYLSLTYSQISSDTNGRKTNILNAIAPNSIIIMDESHTAAGMDSKLGQAFQSLVSEASGVTYLSATYAKRPDNMMLYSRTDLGLAFDSKEALINAIEAGGIGMQNYIAGKLAEAGQMIRRERSFDGISIKNDFLPDPDKKISAQFDSATETLRAIQDLSAAWAKYVETEIKPSLQESGGLTANVAGNQADKAVKVTLFSSVVHNYIAQLTLAIKARRIGENAVAMHKKGQKVVIALENTMEAALVGYIEANGISMNQSVDLNFGSLLEVMADKVLVYSVENPYTGKPDKIQVPINEVGSSEIRNLYRKVQRLSESLVKADIPASPIDAIRKVITDANLSVAEVTGRKYIVDYSDGSKIKNRPTEERNRKATVDNFNSGALDIIILNQAGSTGLSIHASEKFGNQQPRHMIVAQPSLDINTFMQMLGRVNRTGQVVKPEYTIAWLDLPSEKRPAAVLAGKMKKLNANTSGNDKSATSVESIDILNQYGDEVVERFVSENAVSLSMMSVKLVELPETEQANYFLGKLAVLPVRVQESILNQIEQDYTDLIDYLNATGQNELSTEFVDLDAKPIEQKEIGDSEGGQGVFSEPAYLTKTNIKANGKAPDAKELAETLQQSSQADFDEVMVLINEDDSYLKLLQKTVDDVRKSSPSNYQLIEAKEQHIADYKDELRAVNVLFGRSGMYSHGAVIRVQLEGHESGVTGVVTGFSHSHKKGTGNPLSASKFKLKVMIADRARSIPLTLSQARGDAVIGPSYIDRKTLDATFDRAANLPQREDRYIMTGNLLRAQANSKQKGRIIPFTANDGRIIQGLLLPQNFDPENGLKTNINASPDQLVQWLTQTPDRTVAAMGFSTGDGMVSFVRTYNDDYMVFMPKSVSRGKKFWGNEKVEAIIGKQGIKGSGTLSIKLHSQKLQRLANAINEIEKLTINNDVAAADYNNRYGKKAEGFTNKDIVFSRSGNQQATRTKWDQQSVKRQLNRLTQGWTNKPKIEVVQSERDLPADIQDAAKSQGAEGTIDGVLHQGVVYVVAGQMRNEADIERVLFHEALGHYGLREMFGNAFPMRMRKLYKELGGLEGIKKLSKQYGFKLDDYIESAESMTDAQAQVMLTDEVLAHLAQQGNIQPTLMQEIISLIRQGLRKLFGNFKFAQKLNEMSDVEVLQLVADARKAVTGGVVTRQATNTPAFSRGATASTQAFKKWFGDSKVVDADGKPMVVYHGTYSDFNEFSKSNDGLGFHFGDIDAANIRLQDTAEGRINDAEVERLIQRSEALFKKVRQFESQLEKKNAEVPDGELLKALEDGSDIGLVFDKYKYVPTKAEAEQLSKLKTEYQKSQLPTGRVGEGAQIMPYYLSAKKLIRLPDLGVWNPSEVVDAISVVDPRVVISEGSFLGDRFYDPVEIVNGLKDAGYDGIVYANRVENPVMQTDSYTVFEPTQIKSATGNQGTFDPNNPDIAFSRGATTSTQAFKKWFGDSKVVDANGEPMVVYHGTSADFTVFDPDRMGSVTDSGWYGKGFYFTPNQNWTFAQDAADSTGGSANVMPVYLSIKNPVYADAYAEQGSDLVRMAKERGRDGVIVRYPNDHEKAGQIAEIVVWDNKQIKSATGNQGTFDSSNPDIRFSRGGRRPAREGEVDFETPSETFKNVAMRKIADKFQVLKQLQENIEKAGGVITEENNAYRAEERFHGKATEDLRVVRETMTKPLADKMAKYNIEQAKLDEYLYAKHAPERNAHAAKINPALEGSGSGMTNQRAAEIVQEIANSGKQAQYDDLATIVYDMLATRREIIRKAGLESDEMIDAWEDSYQFYVPLKGFADNDIQDGMPRTGKGFNIAGRESKRAMGRSSEAASPSSYAIMDLTETIIRKRKNEVGNSLLKLVEDNPNSGYWQVFTNENPDTDRKIIKYETDESKAERKQAKRLGLEEPAKQFAERVEDGVIPMALLPDNYFQTKRDGISYFIKMDSDPRLMKAMKNIGPDTSNFVIQTLAGVTRVLSALNTSYNPEFVIGNFARDIQTAVLNLMAEQSRDDGIAKGEKIVKQTIKDVPTAMRAIYRSLRGKSASNAEWDGWFKEFREAGAQTGYYDRKDLDGQAKELENMVAMAKGGLKGNSLKWARSAAQLVEDMNSTVENAVRLSAYVNARRAGISKNKAASLAKNMTVNFNRRGEVGTTLNALYMFANASIQGIANFARTMTGLNGTKGDPIWSRLNTAQKISTVLMAGAYGLAMLNRLGAGEDEDDGKNFYDKVEDHIKERNIVIMKSMLGGPQDGTYWKIPLPYGYNIFHVLGTTFEAVSSGNMKIGKGATDITMAALGSFSPIGFAESQTMNGLVLKNLMPTIGKPLVDVALNENFMKSSIYNENFPFGTPKPDSSLGRRGTPESYKAIASFLNEVSGGNQWRSGAIDINPDVMRYFVDYVGGGAGAFVTKKVPKMAYNIANGIEVEPHQQIFLNRVHGKVRPFGDMDKFFSRRDDISQARAQWRDLTGSERSEFYRENRELISMQPMVSSTEKRLTSLRQQRDRIYSSDVTPKQRDDQLKVIEGQMKQAIDRFNRTYGERGL